MSEPFVDIQNMKTARQVRGENIDIKTIQKGEFWDILGINKEGKPVDILGFRFKDLMIIAEPHIANIEIPPHTSPDYVNTTTYDVWALGENGSSIVELTKEIERVGNHSSREVAESVIHDLFLWLSNSRNSIREIQIPNHAGIVREQVVDRFQNDIIPVGKFHRN